MIPVSMEIELNRTFDKDIVIYYIFETLKKKMFRAIDILQIQSTDLMIYGCRSI